MNSSKTVTLFFSLALLFCSGAVAMQSPSLTQVTPQQSAITQQELQAQRQELEAKRKQLSEAALKRQAETQEMGQAAVDAAPPIASAAQAFMLSSQRSKEEAEARNKKIVTTGAVTAGALVIGAVVYKWFYGSSEDKK